jgi:hypothetical protein
MIAADTRTLIRHLESVPAASFHAYQLRDNNGRSMDCLEVFQIAENRNIVYGVYHSIENGVLSLHLARSVDLHHWTHITLLDAHASQAAIWPCDNGAYLLAYETDKPNSVQIRLRYYRSLHNLASAKHERQFDVPRTLAPTAEGTPSFEFVNLKQNNLDASEINIRFHFFKDAQKDQLARGVLTDFRAWKAALSDEINSELQRRNWFGNLGDRDKFTWDDKAFYLQEIQGKAGDWSSWRVCLCNEDGMPISTLSMRTHSGSTAFSNPSATWIADAMGTRKLVVTLFVLSEGSAGAEAGSLLYVIEDSKR